MGRAVSQQLWPRLFVFSALIPLLFSLSLLQRAELLEPTLYILRLQIKSNLSKQQFTYLLHNEVHFNIKEEVDLLVLETQANYIYLPAIVLEHSEIIPVEDFHVDIFYCFRRIDGKAFPKGHYTMLANVLGQITEETLGIKYVMHRDKMSKNW